MNSAKFNERNVGAVKFGSITILNSMRENLLFVISTKQLDSYYTIVTAVDLSTCTIVERSSYNWLLDWFILEDE